MRPVFLILAIWGAVHPMFFFVQWFLAEGWSLFALVDAWRTNPASTGLTLDIVISAVVLIIWILSEVATTRNFRSLWAIVATICIGVSCGLPLYLYLRDRVVYSRDRTRNRNL